MKSSLYRIMKLKGGEEIIASMKGQSEDKFVLERPMIFEQTIISSPFGEKEITTLNNWIKLSDEIITKIPKDYVITFIKPSKEISKLYELEKEREDVIGLKPTIKNKPNIPNIKDFMSHINQARESLPPIPSDEFEESPEDIIDDNSLPKNFVAMTLVFPPEIFLMLAEYGLIDSNLLEEMIKSGKIDFNDMEDRRDKEDYGNKWMDWSPYLEDYTDDDEDEEKSSKV